MLIRRSFFLSPLVGVVLLIAVPAAFASPTSHWASGLDRRHAHFSLAGEDSIGAWRLLDVHGASASADSSTLGFSLRQILAWSLGDSTGSGALLPQSSDELVSLQAFYDLDSPSLARPMPRAARPRLAWAAHALVLGDWSAARAALEDDVPREWKALRSTLLAELHHHRAEPGVGNDAERRALEEAAESATDGPLHDHAALRLFGLALGERDTTRALQALEIVDTDGALAPRAAFLRTLLTADEDAQAWQDFLDTRPPGDLAREATLRLASLRLESGATEAALAAYRSVLDRDAQDRLDLESLSSDPQRASERVWSNLPASLDGPSDGDVARLASTIVAQLLADFEESPAQDLVSPPTSAPRRAGLEPSPEDRTADAVYARSMRAAVLDLRDARRSLADLLDRESSELRRLGRAGLESAASEHAMRAAEDLLSTSAGLADSTRARWVKMRDRAIERLRQRRQHLESIVTANAAIADRIDLLYLQGPMSRLEHRDLESIPRPEVLVDGERVLRQGLDEEGRDFALHSESAIDRSVEEILLPQLFARLDSTTIDAQHLRARQDSVSAWLVSRRSTMEHSPARQRAEDDVAEASERAHQWADRWSEFRQDRAASIVRTALDELGRAGEGPLYGAAVSALESAFVDEDPDLLAESHRLLQEFLDRYPLSVARSDARYRLADLLLVTARADFQRRMGRYLEDGKSHAALMPLWNVDEPLALYESILAEDPSFDRADRVLFQLGMLHADLADGLAEAPLYRLVEEHPHSPLLPAAHLRLGELAFEAKQWSTASEHLQIAARSEDLSTRVVALYKLGWARYALDDFARAAERFVDLLDVYDRAGTEPELGFDIAAESRDLLVRSLARAGGASAFVQLFDRRGPRDYESQVLLDLGHLLESYALANARDEVDQAVLERYPTHPKALGAALRHLSHLDTDASRVALADRFLTDSPWAAAQASDSSKTAGDEFARGIFERRAQARHRDARDATGAGPEWSSARLAYEDLLTRWPDHPLRARWQLLAAECAAADRQWPMAIEFAHAAASSDSTALSRTAAWQAVALRDAWYRASRPDSASAGEDSLANELVAEMDSYRGVHPHDERSVDLQWRAAQLEWTHQHLGSAAERLRGFAVDHPADPRSAVALRSRADIYYQQEDFVRASAAFADAAEHARARGEADRGELENWVVHCEYRGAQAASEDSTLSADEVAANWQRVGELWPDYVDADKAFYNAGSAWSDASRARDAFRRVWTNYALSSLRVDAGRNLASSYEQSGEPAEAARMLREIAHLQPQPEDAADLLLYAVDLYEKSNHDALRRRTLDDYVEMFPDDHQTRSAVLAERATAELDAMAAGSVGAAADIGTLLGGPSSSLGQLLALAKTDPSLLPPSLQARVRFLEAEAERDAYAQLKLTQPLERSLAAKQAALTELLAAYSKVSESHRAPWSQAAAFRSGEALLAFGDALRASERPSDLEGDDRLAYDEVIEEQAWNFYDRAEDAFKQLLTADTPEEAQVWVERARERFYRKTSERYLHMPSFDFPIVRAEAPPRASIGR